MDQQIVFGDDSPPLAYAFGTEFSKRRRCGGAAEAEHVLIADGFVHSDSAGLRFGRKKLAAQRDLFRDGGNLMACHVGERIRFQRVFAIQKHAQIQAVVHDDRDGPKIATIADTRLFKHTFRMAPGLGGNRRNLA